jgi:hypothetical protein
MKQVVPAALLCLALPAQAGDTDWRTSWDIALHATVASTQLQLDSMLNPGNAIAGLAESTSGLEARLNFKLETEAAGLPLRLTMRPILSMQHEHGEEGRGRSDDAYFSQWQLRAPLSETLSLSLGREVMNWGPAQFRSPTSPLYFDNGRANPSRELTGVDSVKLAWTPNASTNVSLAWVKEGDDAANAWSRTWLMKAERRGDDWTGGLILAQAAGREAFYAAFAQWTLDEAWMLYGEAASATHTDALISPADPAQPFSLQAESARHGIALLGTTRTFESGHGLSLEYLHNGHGYRSAEDDAYFNRAAASPASAALALGTKPPLLGRHYLHLVWQSNPLEEGDYWRAMWSRNLDDTGNEWAIYYDHPINSRLSLYALGVLNEGGAQREFAALIESRLQIGMRLALP